MADGNVNLRSVILDALMAINEDGEYSHLVMREVLKKYQYLSGMERSFISRVSLGTVERKLTLDYLLDRISKTPVHKMKPVIRNILRMSAYQLCYMDRVEAYAVCNEAVKLAVKRGFSGLKGFVNGVLRNLDREYKNIPYPDMSIKYSTPEWIVADWENRFGHDLAKSMLKSQFVSRPLWIRVNTTKTTPEELTAAMERHGVRLIPSETMPEAMMMEDYDYLEGYEEWQKGLFFVQDYSSMQVVESAGIKPGDYVLDVCAAPGGKATHAAERLAGTGMVEARDLSSKKISLIRANIGRLGLDNIRASVADATEFTPESEGKADVVIADLPCSGLGILNKKPDIKYHGSAEQCLELAALQRKILTNCVRYVKPGGTLMYSTCTIRKEENEDNAAWLQEEMGLILESEQQLLPSSLNLQDGFFIAKFKKQS